MKKDVKKIIGYFFVIAFIALNIVLNSISQGNNKSLSLKNLNALQATAGETTCDQSNPSSCTIEVDTGSGTVTGRSTGWIVGSL